MAERIEATGFDQRLDRSLVEHRLGSALGEVVERLVRPVGVAIGAFSERPFLVGGIILVVGALLFLCFRGAGAAAPAIRFPTAGALLLLSTSAGVAALKLILTALAPWAGEGALWEAYPPFAFGMLLMAFAAAGIRQALAWRVPYWIMFVATVVGVALAFVLILALALVFAS